MTTKELIAQILRLDRVVDVQEMKNETCAWLRANGWEER